LVDPLRIYLLTAHIDDQPMGLRAPGADDNASGSVAVMTAARLLAAEDLAYTVRFVLFTGEEQGLHGSAAYAAQCAAKQEDIRGVINLDMIAYNSDPAPIVDLYAIHDVPASVALTRQFAYVVRAYDLDVIPHRFADSAGMPTSDQGSFIAWGYPVMLVIEDMDDFSPHWHKITDRLVTLDLDYYTANTRAVVATIAHLAVPIR
ncbi:MAG: Zn-dependent exopeptidase M28, partial [Chloroflexi bacterium]|nr:Zn-dependent exopeptidase M28 [Chloroflexota bacterium]